MRRRLIWRAPLKLPLASIGALSCLAASPAHAVVCSVSPQSVSFGNYDPLNPAALDGVGNINVSCDASTSFTISLSAGSGTYTSRKMMSGTEPMAYNLYTDASRLLIWGDGTGSTSTVSTTAASGDYTVYGRIPDRQNIPAGTYTDSITVTVTY